MDPKKILLKVIDEDGLLELISVDLLDGVVKKKLDELAASSDNSLDDALVAMIYPLVKEQVVKFLKEKIDELKA